MEGSGLEEPDGRANQVDWQRDLQLVEGMDTDDKVFFQVQLNLRSLTKVFNL